MSNRTFYASLFAFSFALRLVTAHPPLLGGRDAAERLVVDEQSYWALGETLAKTGKFLIPEVNLGHMQGGRPGDRTAFRTPVFPTFLAAHYALFGDEKLYPRLTQMVLDSLSVCWLGWLGRRLFSPRAGRIAALAWCFSPHALFYTGLLFTETLTVHLFILAMAATWWAYNRRTVSAALASGLIVGLAILSRQYLLLAPVFWSGFAVAASASRRLTIGRGVLAAYIIGVLFLPGLWIARNAYYLGSPIISTQADVIWYGNNPLARGSNPGVLWHADHPMVEDLKRRYPGFPDTSERFTSEVYRKEAKAYFFGQLTTHPVHLAVLELRKIAVTFLPMSLPGYERTSWFYILYVAGYAAIAPLAIGGCVLAFRYRYYPQTLLLAAPVLSLAASVLGAYGNDRYRLGIESCLVVFAAFAADRLMARGTRRQPAGLPSVRVSARAAVPRDRP